MGYMHIDNLYKNDDVIKLEYLRTIVSEAANDIRGLYG